MAFSSTAYSKYVSFTKKQISSVKFKIGSTYYEATINSMDEGDTALVITAQLNLDVTSEVTVSQVCLYDTGSNLFYSKTENIKFNPVNEGLLVKITINFEEV